MDTVLKLLLLIKNKPSKIYYWIQKPIKSTKAELWSSTLNIINIAHIRLIWNFDLILSASFCWD